MEVVLRETRAVVAGLDVDGLSGARARELVAEFAELERLARPQRRRALWMSPGAPGGRAGQHGQLRERQRGL